MRTFIALSILTAFAHFNIEPTNAWGQVSFVMWLTVCIIQDAKELKRKS